MNKETYSLLYYSPAPDKPQDESRRRVLPPREDGEVKGSHGGGETERKIMLAERNCGEIR
jgi:hypothetical protein